MSTKAGSLQDLVSEHTEKIIELTRKNNQLNNNLNYYKKKASERIAKMQSPSLPLDEAVVKAVNDVIESRGRYKLMKRSNVASAVAKAIFHPSFVDGIVLPEVIKLSKNWLQKNVFTPSTILKQMDIHGGTLNYEGITVLNDVETASESVGQMGRVLTSLSSLQCVAQRWEKAGESLCPFELISTDFGEGVEFDYAKTTRLVIDAFCLSGIGKERPINISASIDAAKLTKNITLTSAGLKMMDVEGRDPLKNKRSFIYDENSLHDLQSRNTIFLMKIILTKETKESFKQFDDVFQFFCLCGEASEGRQGDPKNLPKYHWEELEDLQPLDITTTTDMAADWKLIGAGGGVKKTKHFCTLCPLQSADVHQPNAEHCQRFCSGKPDDWCCYHHPILCSDVKEDLLQELATLKSRILSDLELLSRYSKIKCPSSNAVSRTTDKRSIYFCPQDDNSRDTFIELLENELILRQMCPTGELEELRQRLLEELLLEEKLKRHIEKLEHCSHLEACLIKLRMIILIAPNYIGRDNTPVTIPRLVVG